MKKELSFLAVAVIGFIFLGIGFVFSGILPDLLRIVGFIFIIIGFVGILRKNRDEKKYRKTSS